MMGREIGAFDPFGDEPQPRGPRYHRIALTAYAFAALANTLAASDLPDGRRPRLALHKGGIGSSA